MNGQSAPHAHLFVLVNFVIVVYKLLLCDRIAIQFKIYNDLFSINRKSYVLGGYVQ